MKKLSIGLIGFGIWGNKILEELIFLKTKVHVFDSGKKGMDAAISMGAASFDTAFDSFVKHELDGIIVAAATTAHAAVLTELAALGLPVFVEKPLVSTQKDLDIIRDLNLHSVFVMHIWQYHPGVKLLASLAHSGELGEITGAKSVRTNWTSPRKDTDSLWNLAIHDLSICETILGFIPQGKQVVAEKHNGVIRGVSALMGTSPFYNFEVSNRYPEKLREIRVFGTKGVAILKDEKVDYVMVYKGDDTSELAENNFATISFDSTPPLRIELKVFLEYLDGGPEPSTKLEDGIRLCTHLLEIERKCFEIK
jgi:predicted dehydrogenase